MNDYYIFLVLLWVVRCCCSQLDVQVKSLGAPSKNLMDAATILTVDSNYYSVDLRTIHDWSVTDILLASDIEGNLHGLERDTGEIIWSIRENEPLVSTSSHDSFSYANDTWIVEPFGDGSLYYFNEQIGLNKLPTSIKNLVMESPFSINGDDKIYTGIRKTSLYSIDITTGKVLSRYGSPISQYITPSDNVNTVLLGKTTYELTIHSKNDSVWNVTYVSWGPNGIDNDLVRQNVNSPDGIFITPFYDQSLLGINDFDNVAAWISKMPSIAINVFDIFNKDNDFIILPHPLRPTEFRTSIQDLGIYINKTSKGSWYAMSGDHYPSLVLNAPISKYSLNVKFNLPSDIKSHQSLADVITGVYRTFPVTALATDDDKQLSVNNTQDLDMLEQESQLLLPAGDVLSIDPPPSNKVLGFLKRIFEDLAMTLLVGVILFTLSKLGYIPPLLTILSKLGFADKNTVELAERLLTNDPEKSLEKSIDTSSQHSTGGKGFAQLDAPETVATKEEKSPKKVTIVEPLEDGEKKKRKRGARGGKRNRKSQDGTSAVNALNNLIISDSILGYGSHGTIVYKGTFENRPVAIKRMLLDFYDVASHEVTLLQESDDHPNVIRYYCSQENERFLYIAIELCSCSLDDIIERGREHPELASQLNTNLILYQLASGLNYLHSMKIVHRDLKPQNILVAPAKSQQISNIDDLDLKDNHSSIRILISDFGLCKKLENDQSSFRATTANAAGTQGWRAPELLVDENDAIYNFVTGSPHSSAGVSSVGSTSDPFLLIDAISKRRLTRAIDVFSLGCVFYYVLTRGFHPFGDKYLREGNIIKGEYDIGMLDSLPDSFEATDLISSMIQRNPRLRPDTRTILQHPLFWSHGKRLDFLLKVSDRFEIERRDPPSPLLSKLETVAIKVVEGDWCKRFDKLFMDNLGKYRKYHPEKLMDLLRALRNKYHHFNDLPEELHAEMVPLPNGFYDYFNSKFPNMLMEIYYVVKENLSEEHVFKPFF